MERPQAWNTRATWWCSTFSVADFDASWSRGSGTSRCCRFSIAAVALHKNHACQNNDIHCDCGMAIEVGNSGPTQ